MKFRLLLSLSVLGMVGAGMVGSACAEDDVYVDLSVLNSLQAAAPAAVVQPLFPDVKNAPAPKKPRAVKRKKAEKRQEVKLQKVKAEAKKAEDKVEVKAEAAPQPDKTETPVTETVPAADGAKNNLDTLRQAILTGQLQPGERLMEIHLADKLGVSRTPIREAIRKLELEGLVTMIPRKGAEVARITEKNLKDVLEVRRALDALCAELACDRITNEEKSKLKEACNAFEEATRTKDARVIAQADVALHDIIVEATGNDRLIQLIHNLSQQMYRYRFEYIKDESQHDTLTKEHRVIYESIINNDKETAARAAKLHIDNQEASILRQIREENAAQEKKNKGSF